MKIFTVFLKFQLFLFSLGEEGKSGLCFRGSVIRFPGLCATWGSGVIQCDGGWGREAVTVVIVFLFHGITYQTHTTASLARSWKKSDCPGTEKCGGGDGVEWLVGDQALRMFRFTDVVQKC